ncbi:thiol-activated cytolysin family protein [Porphyromonadaceae bacterium W3.11]|nr:thiol-activated cytolysin family protein [Porphyromonadaceae bacterium W3.11]
MTTFGCQNKSAEIDSIDSYQAGKGVSLEGLPAGAGMIRANENVPDPVPIGEPSEGEDITPTILNGIKGVIISRSSMYRAGVTFNEYLLFNPMSNLIFPGNVLVGNSISNGRYIPVKEQEVGDITWSSPDLSPKNTGYKFVAKTLNPNFSDYTGVLQEWNSVPKNPTATTTTFEVTEVNSLKEFSSKFGIGIDTEEIKAGFSLSGKVGELKTHILVKFIQKAYSISMDIPRRPILQKANVASMDGVLPVYISDIFYGRLGYALISTDHDYLELLAALEILVPKYSLEISSKYKKILDTSLTQFVIIGGESGSHGQFVTEGWEGFKKALSEPLHSYDAVPIAMTMRYADDNSVARVLLTGEYPVTESYFVKDCESITFSFRSSSISAKAGNREDIYVWGNTTLKVPSELTGTNEVQEYPLISIPKEHYVKVKKDQSSPFDNPEEYQVKLIRPEGMSMHDFLDKRVEIESEFHNTNPAGTIVGQDLGKRTVSVKIQDLLFNAMHGQYIFNTRRNTRLDYSGSIVFELFHDVEGVQEVPSTIVETDGPQGTSTRAIGRNGQTLFSQFTQSNKNK